MIEKVGCRRFSRPGFSTALRLYSVKTKIDVVSIAVSTGFQGGIVCDWD